jgi:hypothetical protein
VFVTTLYELLGQKKDGSWMFAADKGESDGAGFVTAFASVLPRRLMDYHNDQADDARSHGMIGIAKSKNIRRRDAHGNKDQTVVTVVSSDAPLTEESAVALSPYEREIKAEAVFASVIGDYDEMSAHLTEKERRYFKGFFTFDTTKAVKSQDELAEAACKYDSILFPHMLLIVLGHLMEGTFSGMRDVADNPLRPGIRLEQRLELLAQAFCVVRQTVSNNADPYNDFRKAVFGRLGVF